MIVICQEQFGGKPGCGRSYDDARRWTICPHNRLDEDPKAGLCGKSGPWTQTAGVVCTERAGHGGVCSGVVTIKGEAPSSVLWPSGVVTEAQLENLIADAYEHKPPATVTVRIPACGKSGPWTAVTGKTCSGPEGHGGPCSAIVLVEGGQHGVLRMATEPSASRGSPDEVTLLIHPDITAVQLAGVLKILGDLFEACGAAGGLGVETEQVQAKGSSMPDDLIEGDERP